MLTTSEPSTLYKLSKLQKAMLMLAWDNVYQGKYECDGREVDVYSWEVKRDYYRFQCTPRGWTGEQHFSRIHNDERHSRAWWVAVQPRMRISDARYAAASVAILRAFYRLEDRGLAEYRSGMYRKWSGVKLTPAGILAAGALKAPPATVADLERIAQRQQARKDKLAAEHEAAQR